MAEQEQEEETILFLPARQQQSGLGRVSGRKKAAQTLMRLMNTA